MDGRRPTYGLNVSQLRRAALEDGWLNGGLHGMGQRGSHPPPAVKVTWYTHTHTHTINSRGVIPHAVRYAVPPTINQLSHAPWDKIATFTGIFYDGRKCHITFNIRIIGFLHKKIKNKKIDRTGKKAERKKGEKGLGSRSGSRPGPCVTRVPPYVSSNSIVIKYILICLLPALWHILGIRNARWSVAKVNQT